MIIVKFMGGMGNQMFQYAFAKSISDSYGIELRLDKSFLQRRDLAPNFVYRDYDLDIFNITAIEDVKTTDYVQINEPHFHYSQQVSDSIKNLISLKKNILLNGYWQSPKYFKNKDELIKKEFCFKNKINQKEKYSNLLSDIQSSESVMINVRRTDYLTTDFHGVMGLDYITKAKELISSKIKNPKFFIFSDDISWCKNNLIFKDSLIVEHQFAGNKFESYLQLMTECKHFIIPNSTFAWWAAYLSKNENKIVISPKHWFNATKNINAEDIYMDNWIKI